MPNVKLALSYYAERPRDIWAEKSHIREYMKRKIDFERNLYDTLDGEEVPRTIFILGNYLEGCLSDFTEHELKEIYVTSKYSDPQSHGQDHLIIREKEFENKKPVTTGMFLDDLKRANIAFERILDIRPTGAGFPYGFESDSSDNTELLTGLNEMGFVYISSDTSGKETLEAPLSDYRQPHTYKDSGFPSLVQIPTSGWQDVIFTEEKRKMFDFYQLKTKEEILQHYKNLITTAYEFDIPEVYVSFCLHPWAVMEYDPELEITNKIVDFTRDRGADIVSFSQIADEVLKREA